jgi:hypothetical protein
MEEQDGKKRVKYRPTNRKNDIEQSNDYFFFLFNLHYNP